MPLSQRLVVDPTLGYGTVFRGSRIALGACITVGGMCFWLALACGSLTSATSFLASVALFVVFAGLFWVGAFWTWQTQLVVGTSGFRYSTPRGTTEISWDLVSACRAEQSGHGRGRIDYVAVTLLERPFGAGSGLPVKLKVGYPMELSASAADVSHIMNARLASFRNVNPSIESGEAETGVSATPQLDGHDGNTEFGCDALDR